MWWSGELDTTRLGINARLALCRGIALSLIRSTNTDEALRENLLVEGVHIGRCVGLNPNGARSREHLLS